MTTATSGLAARIAAMREVTKQTANKSTVSEATNSTPLEVYVRIYNKCSSTGKHGQDGSCYTNYMEGAKLLYKWLSPIEVPSDIIFNSLLSPDLISGYAAAEVACILSGQTYGAYYNYIHNLVVYYTAKHILEEVTE